MKTFENVASLKLAKLTAGQVVQTKGYYTAGDGGGIFYLIKTAAQYAATPDEYGDHTLANTNVAVLQKQKVPTVKHFGAKGDGTTDDTAAFTAAKDWGTTEVPVGSYEITTSVTGKFFSFGSVTILTGTVTSITNLVP
jgi:hypothetical protein